MHRIGPRRWIKWFMVTAIIFGGCGPPITTRLVTIELEKPSEAEIQNIETIGIVTFSSPASDVGSKMAAQMARGLDKGVLGRGPFAARVIQPPEDFKPTAGAIRKLGQKYQVDALILGETSEFSVQTSRAYQPMLSNPEFGPGDPSAYEWVGVQEEPTIKDTYYYRILPQEDPDTVEVSTTKLVSTLTLRMKLVETQNGGTLWDQEISRRFETVRFTGRQADAEAEIDRLVLSIVNEVVARLKPQEYKVQRLIKVPHFGMTPVAAKWVRRGIQAAALEDWLKAEELFLRALEEAPEECNVYGNLGVAYENNGRLREAVAAYERAYRCRPRDPTYRLYSDNLQRGFSPNLKQEDLPTMVLGVRGDGTIYMSGGESDGHSAGQRYTIYRAEVERYEEGKKIKGFKETDLARGRLVRADEKMSLGQLLLYKPELKVRRGDLVRFETE